MGLPIKHKEILSLAKKARDKKVMGKKVREK